MAHHNTDLWRATAPIDGAFWGMWPLGGAWLCLSLWDEVQYQQDEALLRRIYPLMRGAAEFFLDTLVEDPKGRGLVTSPSISPENPHGAGVSLCAGPAMDRQILRDLFGAVLEAHRRCGDTDAGFAESVSRVRARLPADRVGAAGQLQEWLDDWDAQAPDRQHRHVSHLYAVFPSEQINVRDTPELVRAARTTLNVRGDQSTGWATAWRLALWARLGEGDRAHSILQGLLSSERTYPNLFDAHPPFQIDGRGAARSGSCPRCRRPGPKARCAGCARAVGWRSTSSGATAGRPAPSSAGVPARPCRCGMPVTWKRSRSMPTARHDGRRSRGGLHVDATRTPTQSPPDESHSSRLDRGQPPRSRLCTRGVSHREPREAAHGRVDRRHLSGNGAGAGPGHG
jgi:hypothetical protein